MESFHKALSLKRDDAFSTNMLNNVIEHLVDDITPFEENPSKVPNLPPAPNASEMTGGSKNDLIFNDSEDTLKSAIDGVETSIEMDNSTDVEMEDS